MTETLPDSVLKATTSFSQNVKGLLSPFWISSTLVTQNQPFGIGNGNSCFGIIIHLILMVKISQPLAINLI